MQSIFEAAPIGIGVVADRTFLQVNEEFCKITGYDREEIIGKNTRFVYPSEEDYETIGRKKAAQLTENASCRIETLWKRKNGSIYDILLSITVMDPKKPESGEVFTAMDISERKKMENALIKSEAKSRELLDNLESAVMIVDTDGIWKYLNNKAAENLKGEPKDFLGKNIFDYLPRHIDKLSFIKSDSPQSPSDITEYEAAFKIAGEEKYYLVSDQVLKDDDGKPYGVLSNSIDITSRKLAEEALKISEEKYRYLFNANHDAILVYPLHGEKPGYFIEANETATLLLGYTREELLNMSIFDLDKGISSIDFSARKKSFKAKGKNLFETKSRKKDGSSIDVEISAVAMVYLGKPVVMAIIRDITETKKAEAEIKEREAKFSAFMNNLQGIAYIKDSYFRYVFVNKKFMDLFKLDLYDWIGKSDQELNSFPENVIEEIASHDRMVLQSNQALETIEHIPIGNEIHYWKMIKFPLLLGDSKENLTAGVGIDITSEKRLEMAMNNIIDLNHELDDLTIDDIMKRCMDACETATNSKISFFHFINPDKKTIELHNWSHNTLQNCSVPKLADGYPISEAGVWIDCVNKREPVVYNDYNSLPHKKGLPDGHVNVVRLLTIPIFEEDKITAILGVGNKETDYDELDIKLIELISYNIWKIVRRKKTEEDLKNSLIEKDTLLRELYHRTKNNMQVISSMLLLHTFSSNDANLNRVLVETSNRIKAMALVHEKLYQSKNLSKINLKDYITDLLKFSENIYSLRKNKINIKANLEDVYVLIDYAVPCGLVINEILSNTFQNSFQEEIESEMLVKLYRNEENQIIFISHDNSIGNPYYAENNSNIFGIELIKTIVEHQLGGKIEYNSENGDYIKISFKDNQYNTRV
jgi:PAS domain S-box-containing protein